MTLSTADVRYSHLVDDYETTRTHAKRTIDVQIDLLGDALHALQAGRTEVVEEFIERAATALSVESEWLAGRRK
jgi:hypothetical protein